MVYEGYVRGSHAGTFEIRLKVGREARPLFYVPKSAEETVALHNAGALHHFVRFEESAGTYSLVLWMLGDAP